MSEEIYYWLHTRKRKTYKTQYERRCPRRLAVSPLAYPEGLLVPPVHVSGDIDPPLSPGSGHPAPGSERRLRGLRSQNQPPESGESSLPSLAGTKTQTQPDLGECESWLFKLLTNEKKIASSLVCLYITFS